jgi:hypothetical protein
MYHMSCCNYFSSHYIYYSIMYIVGRKWSETLHLVVLPVIVKYDWEFIPLAKALNDLSNKISSFNSRIIVLAPYSQHFPYHSQGLFMNKTSIKLNQSVCAAHKTQYDRSSSTGYICVFFLYVDSLTYAFGWSAFLCRIRFCDTPRCNIFLSKNHHQQECT